MRTFSFVLKWQKRKFGFNGEALTAGVPFEKALRYFISILGCFCVQTTEK